MGAPGSVHRLRVLVVDDEKNIRATLSLCLEEMGCVAVAVGSAEAATQAVQRESFDLAFLDLRLGSSNGLDLLPVLLAEQPHLAVVIITAYATIETAVEAIRRGATDYLPKPFSPTDIRHVVEQIGARQRIAQRVVELEQQLRESVPEVDLDTQAPRMRAVLDTLRRAAAADVPILLRGESGTGKGVLARFVHAMSARRERPFVVVNCPTLSEELLASELFGHARGAFTGAVRDQPGKVEAAAGGTLFLDEIGEISPALQAKLLRFLQDQQFERVGETRTRHGDVRLVAATNRDLEHDIRTGRFREDLLYRLNVIEVVIPPLRERVEDLERLARHFVAFFARAAGRPDADAVSTGTRRVTRLRVARQRARVAQRDRARGDSLAERRHRTRRLPGTHRRTRVQHAAPRRSVHHRGHRARTHPAGDGADADAGRRREDPRHRPVHALAQAEEVRRHRVLSRLARCSTPQPLT